MNELKVLKVASDPVGALPDAVYFIKKAGQTGFDIKVSNTNGDTLFPMNCCHGAGGSGSGTTRPYLSYTAVLFQQAQEAPVVVEEMENELGDDVSFSYFNPGNYFMNIPNSPGGKVLVICNAQRNDAMGLPVLMGGRKLSDQVIELNCAEDNVLMQIDVRFYP